MPARPRGRAYMQALARIRNAENVGNSAWGRSQLARRGARARLKAYPLLNALWRENGWRSRWGYPLIPVPKVEPRGKRG